MKSNKLKITTEHIVYEDQWILVADKPANIPSQGTDDPNKDHFYAAIKRYLPSKQYVAIHHRLDAMTSGLMLFCKSKAYNKAVADLFTQRKIEKIYQAKVMTQGLLLPGQWDVENQLKNFRRGKFQMAKSVSEGGAIAHTSFKLLKSEEHFAWLECYPLTGRMHQIRVHLAEAGTPIEGDFVYSKQKKGGRLMLHAWGLNFKHPKSGKYLEFRSQVSLLES